MIFVKDRRSKISKANPDMPVLQIMKEVGKEWKSLSDQGKVKYQKLADQDKIRYKNELKLFEKEVEKLQVNKPPKAKGRQTNKRKAEPVEISSPQKPQKSDFKRKFLESESTDFEKRGRSPIKPVDEVKKEIRKPVKPIPQRKESLEAKLPLRGTPSPLSKAIIPSQEHPLSIFNTKPCTPREEPVKPVVKVPIITNKEILAPKAAFNTMKAANMGYRMIKEPAPVQPVGSNLSDSTTNSGKCTTELLIL